MKKYLLNNIGSFVDSVVSKEKDNKLDTIFYKVNNAKFHTDLSVNKFLEIRYLAHIGISTSPF